MAYTGPRRKKQVDKSIVRSRTTAGEFESMLGKAKDNETSTPVRAMFRTIDGVPHKFKDNQWVPLTRIN